ncbi:MAG: prolyl oligopeptidase family serine peptidase, partial [Bacteroidota bacterium]
KYLAFTIKPDVELVKELKRKKTKSKDMPKDSLGIYDLSSGKLEKIPGLLSFKMSEKWAGWIAYHAEIVIPKDTSDEKSKEKKRKDLFIHNFATQEKTVIAKAKAYELAEEAARILVQSEGDEDASTAAGLYLFNGEDEAVMPLHRSKGKYDQLTINKAGDQVAFVANLDTTDMRIEPFDLYHWKESGDSAVVIVNHDADFIPENWRLSEKGNLSFSEDQSRLFFGIAPNPVLQDTSLLKDEIINVEVWSYTDKYLYPMQEVRSGREKNRTYLSVFDINAGKAMQLGSMDMPSVRLGDEGNARYAMAINERPYAEQISWVGDSPQDVYLIDVGTGKSDKIYTAAWGGFSMSPKGKYLMWYHPLDSAYYTFDVANKKEYKITDKESFIAYDELNDRPMPAGSYRYAGWTENDEAILMYDRYDIWSMNPKTGAKKNLTNSRSDKVVNRYVREDWEARNIDDSKPMLVHMFDEKSKQSGYYWLDANTGKKTMLTSGDYSYSRFVVKAKDKDAWMFTKQSYEMSSNIFYTTDLKSTQQVSNTNPQQKEFNWGTVELYDWTSLDGQPLQGLLYKPEGFDPNKQYPMMVYFYERFSDRLHSYRSPTPGSSSVSFSFYTSRGYVVFVPDIPYRIGYPGESCYNAVIPGVSSLISEGFIQRENIGVQGHSWGGYQNAYLITKTDIFKCAESGAPVVNMTSAYGGIRWGTGMSRMFQYEKTQSRLGGTLWEKPMRYLENSPLFFADKINTPVLILHNDEDTAVPWYQGIEFFVAMRRLNKPAWLLNYNGEPHGIRKKQNRKDFAKRMQQFFDHYLKGDPMPMWMKDGVPAIEKGINQGFELSDKE